VQVREGGTQSGAALSGVCVTNCVTTELLLSCK